MIEHDGNAHAEEILVRCRRRLRMWKDIYNTLGIDFEYREPSADEMMLAIKLVTTGKKPPKKDK